MPDIFGKEAHGYSHYRGLGDQLASYITQHAAARDDMPARPPHNFNALRIATAASDDVQVLGYATNNLEAIQAQIDQVLYDKYRLPDWIPMKGGIPEGVMSYARRTRDSWGRGRFIDSAGSEMPTVGMGTRIESYPIHYAGIAGQWNLQEMRAAMTAGTALDSDQVAEASRGAMEHIESVGLTGDDDRGLKGFINLEAHATDATKVKLNARTGAKKITAMTAEEMIALLTDAVSDIIESTNAIFGRQIKGPLGIYLPITEALKVTNTRRSGENNRTVWSLFAEENGWTTFAGIQPTLHPVVELKGAGVGDTNRMVMAVKSTDVFEMAIPIQPRAVTPTRAGLTITAPLEYSMSGVNVVRPAGIQYFDRI